MLFGIALGLAMDAFSVAIGVWVLFEHLIRG
jgi:hypothetical protein